MRDIVGKARLDLFSTRSRVMFDSTGMTLTSTINGLSRRITGVASSLVSREASKSAPYLVSKEGGSNRPATVPTGQRGASPSRTGLPVSLRPSSRLSRGRNALLVPGSHAFAEPRRRACGQSRADCLSSKSPPKVPFYDEDYLSKKTPSRTRPSTAAACTSSKGVEREEPPGAKHHASPGQNSGKCSRHTHGTLLTHREACYKGGHVGTSAISTPLSAATAMTVLDGSAVCCSLHNNASSRNRRSRAHSAGPAAVSYAVNVSNERPGSGGINEYRAEETPHQLPPALGSYSVYGRVRVAESTRSEMPIDPIRYEASPGHAQNCNVHEGYSVRGHARPFAAAPSAGRTSFTSDNENCDDLRGREHVIGQTLWTSSATNCRRTHTDEAATPGLQRALPGRDAQPTAPAAPEEDLIPAGTSRFNTSSSHGRSRASGQSRRTSVELDAAWARSPLLHPASDSCSLLDTRGLAGGSAAEHPSTMNGRIDGSLVKDYDGMSRCLGACDAAGDASTGAERTQKLKKGKAQPSSMVRASAFHAGYAPETGQRRPDTREAFCSSHVENLKTLRPCVCCFDALMLYLKDASAAEGLAMDAVRKHHDAAADPRVPFFVRWESLDRDLGRYVPRGFSGSFTPIPFRLGLAKHAISAAGEDPRFRRLVWTETPDIRCRVMVITSLEVAQDDKDWLLNRHGLLLLLRDAGGTYKQVSPVLDISRDDFEGAMEQEAGDGRLVP